MVQLKHIYRIEINTNEIKVCKNYLFIWFIKTLIRLLHTAVTWSWASFPFFVHSSSSN